MHTPRSWVMGSKIEFAKMSISVERNGMMSACDVCMSHATLGAACSQNTHGTLMKGAAMTQTTAACASSASSRPKMLFNYESIIMILYWRFITVDSTINHANFWTFSVNRRNLDWKWRTGHFGPTEALLRHIFASDSWYELIQVGC